MDCKKCSKYSSCKKICAEIEKLLPKPRSGGHSKEFSTDKIEEVYNYAVRKQTGLKTGTHQDSNWEEREN